MTYVSSRSQSSSNCLITIDKGTPSLSAFSWADSHKSSGTRTLLIFPPTLNLRSEVLDSVRGDFDRSGFNTVGGYLPVSAQQLKNPTFHADNTPSSAFVGTNVFTTVGTNNTNPKIQVLS